MDNKVEIIRTIDEKNKGTVKCVIHNPVTTSIYFNPILLMIPKK